MFVIVGVAFPADRIPVVTREYLALKQRFFPGLHRSPHALDAILFEVKGADMRRDMAEGGRNLRRAAFGFLDRTLEIFERHEGRIMGRVWIKGVGLPFDSRAVYTSSMQSIFKVFQALLAGIPSKGVAVADSRNKLLNTNVSHSIFTNKYKLGGDAFPDILEMPLFGHSDNHAGIQLTDLLCSALLFPMAVQTYCQGHLTGVHLRDYAELKARYGMRIKPLQFRYLDPDGRWRGGLTVSDALGQKSGAGLFD